MKDYIHPSIFYTRLIQFRGVRLPIHHRARALTPGVNLESHMHVYGWWEEAGVPREATHTRGAHSTQKGLNLEPSCCEATVLTTTPPCSLYDKVWCKVTLIYCSLYSPFCIWLSRLRPSSCVEVNILPCPSRKPHSPRRNTIIDVGADSTQKWCLFQFSDVFKSLLFMTALAEWWKLMD